MIANRLHNFLLCVVGLVSLHQSTGLLWGEEPKWQSTGPITELKITDGAYFNGLKPGAWELTGTLHVTFEGRIQPHEGSVIELCGPDVKQVKGRFEKVVLPDGWLCDVAYHDKPPLVVLKNFRPDRQLAFPGAEGFGKYTLGGRGGRVIEVTNLNDSGPGSFRAACQAKGPRTIVFRTSGTIALNSELTIKNPYLTIAGQTAPGDGICLRDSPVKFDTEHVIVRYLRIRPGDLKGKELDGFGGEGNYAMIDHCSVSWGIDEVLSINKASNFTVQWCMATESLYNSVHKKGKHGYGGLWGGPGGSWHHNILAHHSSRNPRVSGNKDSGLMDYRNNVIYNWGFNSAYGGELWPRNFINNYYKYGPATKENVRRRIFVQKSPQGRMYADGNFVWGYPQISADNWNGGIDFDKDGGASIETLRVLKPYPVAPVATQTAESAFDSVLLQAGCSHRRDSVDLRIIDEIRNGTATYGKSWDGGGKGIIDSQADVGGWPELKAEVPVPDDDHDGMDDRWELANGLDPKDPQDGNAFKDGYTNLEHYLNSLVMN